MSRPGVPLQDLADRCRCTVLAGQRIAVAGVSRQPSEAEAADPELARG